jgi:tRNA G26 N,N-dimethylase Trm1
MNAKICRECAKYVNYVLGFARITHLYVKKYVKCVKNIRNVQMFVENVGTDICLECADACDTCAEECKKCYEMM